MLVFQAHQLLKARCLPRAFLIQGPASSLSTTAQVYSIYEAGWGCHLSSWFWSQKAETRKDVDCPWGWVIQWLPWAPGIRRLGKLFRCFSPLRGWEAWPHGAVGSDKTSRLASAGEPCPTGGPDPLLSLVSAPQGDMGATGPAGAPGPKGEKGDTVSEGLSTMASVGDPSPWAWGCLPATLASPRTTPPQPLESSAPDWRCVS